MKKKEYPNWVCRDCGLKASKGRSFMISTFSKGKCDICGKITSITEPRDFFYPNFEGTK